MQRYVIVLFLLSIFVEQLYCLLNQQNTILQVPHQLHGHRQSILSSSSKLICSNLTMKLTAYIDDIIYDLKNTDGKIRFGKIPNVDYRQQFSALNTM